MDELTGRMDVLVIRTLGLLTSAVESAVQVPMGTFAQFLNPSLENFARKHFAQGGKRNDGIPQR